MNVDEYLLAGQDLFEKVNTVVTLSGNYNGVHLTQILPVDWS